MPHVTANGIQIYYEEHGTGEPLLLMAPTGWPGSVWDLEQVGELSKSFRVITYDQRGVGLTEQAEGPYTTQLLADDALALLHAISAVPAHIFGFSMGGRSAQLMALKEPAALKKLILAGSDAGGGGARRGGIPFDMALALGEHGYHDFWWDHLQAEFPFSPKFRQQHEEKVRALADTIGERQPPLELYLHHVLARGDHAPGQLLSDIRVPTLVLVGADDRESRGSRDHVEAARELAELIPGARFVEIPNARHLFPWENPSDTNRAIRDFFLADTPNGSANGLSEQAERVKQGS